MANHPTADLARFCAQLQNEDLSATVRERVRYLLLEHLAVTIRGSILLSSLAAYQMQEQMAIGSIRTATIFGRQERAEASWAALANGIASHRLEMDDVENRSSLHPGVVVFPAALALAEQIGSTPADFNSAVVAGNEYGFGDRRQYGGRFNGVSTRWSMD
jgi:2-methylcitrate dehydratase PrpD